MAERILVVDDEEIIRESLSYILKKEGFYVEEAANGKIALDKFRENSFDLVITDLEMPVMKGVELMEQVKTLNVQTAIMVITAFGSLETAISALRNGASDYILKPVEFDELIIKVRKLLELKSLLIENKILRQEVQRNYDYENFVGKSESMKNIFNIIQTVADSESTVLISGNSGTGKELVARALHFNSRRKGKPFIAVNCGAISENLIESELFGHKKGAFTGAITDKEGLVKAADGGTLFLDEISDMPLLLQVKLLRTIQEKEYMPVGTTQAIPVNVRFIASTNRELKDEVASGKFREDLFYRLNVIDIHLPSLKERKEDIPLLANHFLDKYRKEMNKSIIGINTEAMKSLVEHEWKGEVRELENVIERAVIFCKEDFITQKDLPSGIVSSNMSIDDGAASKSLVESVQIYEKGIILDALQKFNFNKDKTKYELLPLNKGSTLYRKMKELNIKETLK